jgi:uncharacterized ion transporter superfamily protein YfcC
VDDNIVEGSNIETLNNKKKKKKFSILDMHTYTIIAFIVLLSYVLCLVVPSGKYKRVYDAASDSQMVVSGSFHYVTKNYPNPFDMFVDVGKGYVDMADILFFVLFAYAFVYLLTKNGTMDAVIGAMLRKLNGKDLVFIPICMLGFGLMGSVAGLYEEVYGLVPVFIGIAVALGYDAVVGGAVAMTGVATGFAAAMINPFSLGIAQSIAHVKLYSGMGFRVATFIVFEAIAILYVMHYAKKVKKDPTKSHVYGITIPGAGQKDKDELMNTKFTKVHLFSCIILLATIATIIITTMFFGWYLDNLAGLFLLSLIVEGFVSGYSFGGTIDKFIEASQEILFGIMTIGFVRAAVILMEDSNILDTITNFFATGLSNTSSYVAAVGMLVVQHLINFFISGAPAQAVATMPIMTPLSDLIHLNRQIAVQSYVFGSGFAGMLWPTQAVVDCAIMGIPIARWYKFIIPLVAIMFVFEVIFMCIAVAINYA